MGVDVEKDILLIDKPKGITSFDVIRILRQRMGIRKMGHAGTLDPLASGLMILGLGEGTKKLEKYLKLPKTYEADILLGVRTTTGDMEGAIIEQGNVEDIDEEAITSVLSGMTGVLELPVPRFSAVKVHGKPLYLRARRGDDVSPPVRRMEITGMDFLGGRREKEGYVVRIRMDVASGVYVRSVAEEIGRRLGLPSVVKDLRRTRIGALSVEDAETI